MASGKERFPDYIPNPEPAVAYAYVLGDEFIRINELPRRLAMHTKQYQIATLRDAVAIKVIAEQMASADRVAGWVNPRGISRRRILGFPSRILLNVTNRRKTKLGRAYESLLKLQGEISHARTPDQQRSAVVIQDAVSNLFARARQRDIHVWEPLKLDDEIIKPWEEEYRERLYSVGS